MKSYPSWTPTLRRWLLVAAALATALAAAVVEEDLRGERALERFEKACADEGKPLDFDFYRPAPVPDAENMFRAPALLRFFRSSESDLPEWEAYEKGKPPLAEMSKVMGNWREGKASDYAAIYGILGVPPPGKGAGAADAAGLILERLGAIRGDLDALDAAALERPKAQIAFGNFMLPSFRALRFFCRALTLRAGAEIEVGRGDDAFRDVYASLRLAEGAERFPHHISLLMSNVIATLSLQPLWEGCVRETWSEGQLRAFEALLAGLHPLRELPAAFAAGRAAYAVAYVKDSRQPFWMPDGWWKINVVRFFESHAGGGDPLWTDPALDRIDLGRIEQADARIDALRRSLSPFDWLIRDEVWGTQIAVLAAFEHDQFQLARTACALERYRLRNGRYPADLSALVPSFLAAPPLDVIDGAPLRYRCADGAHFTVSSVGLGGVDERAWPRKAALTGWATKDWAWVQ